MPIDKRLSRAESALAWHRSCEESRAPSVFVWHFPTPRFNFTL